MKYFKVKIIWISVLQCRVNSCTEQINLFNYLEVPLVTCLKDWTWPVHSHITHALTISIKRGSQQHFSSFWVTLFQPCFRRGKVLTLSCWFVILLERTFPSFPGQFWTCSPSVLPYLFHDWKGCSAMFPSLGWW